MRLDYQNGAHARCKSLGARRTRSHDSGRNQAKREGGCSKCTAGRSLHYSSVYPRLGYCGCWAADLKHPELHDSQDQGKKKCRTFGDHGNVMRSGTSLALLLRNLKRRWAAIAAIRLSSGQHYIAVVKLMDMHKSDVPMEWSIEGYSASFAGRGL